MARAAPSNLPQLFGFPVRIDPAFVVGLLMLFSLNRGDPRFGVLLVVAIAGFTLVHELGHAVAARRAGCIAMISLGFLAGYTAYRPTRPLSRRQEAGITAAGPAAHLLAGVAVLALLGANPLDLDAVRGEAATLAVWWAGPALGILNLLPFTPLDGGHLATLAVERFAPSRGRRIVQVWTALALVALFALVVTSERWRPWAISVAFLGFWVAQDLLAGGRSAQRRADRRQRSAEVAAAAEAEGWTTGGPTFFPPGWGPSPWLRAHLLAARGSTRSAAQTLLEALERGGGSWTPPLTARPDQLVPLLDLLPADPPVDDRRAGTVHVDLLQRTGRLDDAARYAARLYEAHRDPSPS